MIERTGLLLSVDFYRFQRWFNHFKTHTNGVDPRCPVVLCSETVKRNFTVKVKESLIKESQTFFAAMNPNLKPVLYFNGTKDKTYVL